MSDFEDIRFFKDAEVNKCLEQFLPHPMMKALLQFTFPEKEISEIKEIVLSCHSIHDFQTKVTYPSITTVLEQTSAGLSSGGFEKLKNAKPYFYISTHRDIILDTCLLNYTLYDHNLVMTASAIGDNLVEKSFLMALSKLNRNFLVKRGLSPREMLKSSVKLSEYIKKLLFEEHRSVWMAQREGRTKDGNDQTQQGLLKMLAMAKGKQSLPGYMAKLNIVPIAISYEFDPTDALKMPEIMAKRMQETYVKSNNEDFISIMRGALGTKGRIHINAGEVIDPNFFQEVDETTSSVNEQLKLIASKIDEKIHKNYKLWPTNYIAADLLQNSKNFSSEYTENEKARFERRMKLRIDCKNTLELNSFLQMYANPVFNNLALNEK